MKKEEMAKKMNHDVSKGYDVKKGSKRFQHIRQKGLESLNSVGRNEGEHLMMGKNNTQRA